MQICPQCVIPISYPASQIPNPESTCPHYYYICSDSQPPDSFFMVSIVYLLSYFLCYKIQIKSTAIFCKSHFLLPISKTDWTFLLSEKILILLFRKLWTFENNICFIASASLQVELFLLSVKLQVPITSCPLTFSETLLFCIENLLGMLPTVLSCFCNAVLSFPEYLFTLELTSSIVAEISRQYVTSASDLSSLLTSGASNISLLPPTSGGEHILFAYPAFWISNCILPPHAFGNTFVHIQLHVPTSGGLKCILTMSTSGDTVLPTSGFTEYLLWSPTSGGSIIPIIAIAYFQGPKTMLTFAFIIKRHLWQLIYILAIFCHIRFIRDTSTLSTLALWCVVLSK